MCLDHTIECHFGINIALLIECCFPLARTWIQHITFSNKSNSIKDFHLKKMQIQYEASLIAVLHWRILQFQIHCLNVKLSYLPLHLSLPLYLSYYYYYFITIMTIVLLLFWSYYNIAAVIWNVAVVCVKSSSNMQHYMAIICFRTAGCFHFMSS